MIDEVFLQSAVNIRRKYLKISNNMNGYHKRAKEVYDTLKDSIAKLETLQNELKNKGKNKLNSESALENLLAIIQSVEDEGNKLEKLVEPMNKEIEKLSKEEHELYRQIKEKHKDLTDEQILESVTERLIKENIN